MSKKCIVVLSAILLCLCLALTACGENHDTDKTDGNDSNTEQNSENNDGDSEKNEGITEMYITVNNNKLKVTLAENSSVNALAGILNQGDITYTAYANSFEIYGDIGHSLPTNNSQMTSEPGDVLLYIGSNICIFFGSNSYSYTRIGKIEGYTAAQLKEILAPLSTVQVTISLK